MRRFGIGCAFVPLLAPFFAACSSSPPVDPSVCDTSIVDVPCETDACLPARATRFDGCVPSQGVALTAGPNGTSYLYGANLIATLERDGRGRRDEVLPLAYFALVDRGQPVLFGKQDWKTPPGSPSPFPMTPELTLARHGTSGWTKEQIPVRVRTPVDMFSLDPGFVQRAVARKDGTLHFIVAAGPRQFGGIVTRLPTGIYTTDPEPGHPEASLIDGLFLDAQERLRLFYPRCTADIGCYAYTRVYGDPSSERALAPVGLLLINRYGESDPPIVAAYAPQADRFTIVLPGDRYRSRRLRSVDASGESEVTIPPVELPPEFSDCPVQTSGPGCYAACRSIASGISAPGLTVTDDGAVWVVYSEYSSDAVIEALAGSTGAGGGCIPKVLSHSETNAVVVARLDPGSLSVRARLRLDGVPEDVASNGMELQFRVGNLRVAVDVR